MSTDIENTTSVILSEIDQDKYSFSEPVQPTTCSPVTTDADFKAINYPDSRTISYNTEVKSVSITYEFDKINLQRSIYKHNSQSL